MSRLRPTSRLRPDNPVEILPALLLLLLLMGSSAVFIATGTAGLLHYVYPGAALILGGLLYIRNATGYVAYTWWIWLFTPEVRRLADASQHRFDPTNPIMLAPYLVTAIAALSLLRGRAISRLLSGLPFMLAVTAIVYGYLLGLSQNSPLSATYSFVTWAVPLCFGWFFVVRWSEAQDLRSAATRALFMGTLAVGVYGLIQYFILPSWDSFWMQTSGMGAIGYPAPHRVRVFSTLNSPGPLAVFLMGSLIVLLGTRHWLRWPAMVAGIPVFVLGLVRSAWSGWLVGALLVLIVSRQRDRVRVIGTVAAMALVLGPALAFGPAATIVEARLSSITHISSNVSFKQRLALYQNAAPKLASQPLGLGLGATGLSTRLSGNSSARNIDSGLIEIGLAYGWLAGLALAFAIILGVALATMEALVTRDPVLITAAAVALAVSTQLPFGSVMQGVTSLLFWQAVGIAVAGRLDRKTKPRNQSLTEDKRRPIPEVPALSGDRR